MSDTINKKALTSLNINFTVKKSIYIYVGGTSQRLNLRKDQHTAKRLGKLIVTGLNKNNNKSSTIAEHLLNHFDCASDS